MPDHRGLNILILQSSLTKRFFEGWRMLANRTASVNMVPDLKQNNNFKNIPQLWMDMIIDIEYVP